jgi:archaemetzincin
MKRGINFQQASLIRKTAVKEKNNFGEKFLNLIICLLFIFNSYGAGIQNLGSKNQAKMESKIYLVPVGDIKGWMLDALDEKLERIFNCEVEIHERMELPQEAYNKQRNQYFSSYILKKLHSFIKPGKQDKVLGIADEDLYANGLNFVFGEAELGGAFAIISLARLRQSFYGLPEDRTTFLERTVKEAVHEIGHAYRLGHCPNPDCVMHFSNSLADTDKKSASFCSRCAKLLEKLEMRRLEKK